MGHAGTADIKGNSHTQEAENSVSGIAMGNSGPVIGLEQTPHDLKEKRKNTCSVYQLRISYSLRMLVGLCEDQ